MNQLDTARRAQILNMLCEGSSLRSVSCLTGVSINTVSKLLVDAGKACADHHDKIVRNVKSKRVRCDEVWAFCGSKEKNTTAGKKAEGHGDIWTWTAIDADTKLMVGWFVGNRDANAAYFFMHDLGVRRFTRLTNAFSKKAENHVHAVSLSFARFTISTASTKPFA